MKVAFQTSGLAVGASELKVPPVTDTEFRPKVEPGSSLKVKVISRVSPDFTSDKSPCTKTVGAVWSMVNDCPAFVLALPAASVTLMLAVYVAPASRSALGVTDHAPKGLAIVLRTTELPPLVKVTSTLAPASARPL